MTKSENKTSQKCDYCDEVAECEKSYYKNYMLCPSCLDDYDRGEDITGFCSLHCVISGHCDDSC